ncbi:MAG: hypothetical protein JW741_23180, partial [Sedimentisphaerales bacterium]|nr:hypothetical protein [Sedimentisphaerales bacterium]
NGLLDDLRMYNYALTGAEIAQLYYDVTGIATCVEAPAADLSGDCFVDLKDFAEFVVDWLNCGIIPASECP